MDKNNKKQQPNLIEMAKKRRHIYLLEKLQKGPTLSKSEILELSKYESDPNTPSVVDSQEKVAKLSGVSTRTVQNWVKDGMPVTSQGLYDLFEIRAWREIKKQKNRKKHVTGIDWEQRYREYKARLAEIELKKALDEYVSAEIARKEIFANIIVVRQRFLSLPTQIAPQLVGLNERAISNLLKTRIKEVLNELANLEVRVCGERKFSIEARLIKQPGENDEKKTD